MSKTSLRTAIFQLIWFQKLILMITCSITSIALYGMCNLVFHMDFVRYMSESSLAKFVTKWESLYPDYGVQPRVIVNYSSKDSTSILNEFDKIMTYYYKILEDGKYLQGTIYIYKCLATKVSNMANKIIRTWIQSNVSLQILFPDCW